jgi:phospholipase/carboxylesterase
MVTIHTIERPPKKPTDTPPLLVMLHGYGSDEHDLMGLSSYLDDRFHIVSARAILDLGMGYAWYHLYGVPGNLIADHASREHSLEVLSKFLPDLPGRVGADPQRVYLFGFSQGAVMALSLALTMPQHVAGVVACSGYLDEMVMPNVQPDTLTNLDVLLMHGTLDDLLPVDLGRQTNAALEKLPLRLTYREFPIGHGIHPHGLMLAQHWLAERIEGQGDTSNE